MISSMRAWIGCRASGSRDDNAKDARVHVGTDTDTDAHIHRVLAASAVQRKRRIERKEERRAARDNPPEYAELDELLRSIVATSTSGSGARAAKAGWSGQESRDGGDFRWDYLIAIGDVYLRGSYPRFLPDVDAAVQCYRVAAMCPDGRHAGMAQTRFVEARSRPIPREDQRGEKLHTVYADEACSHAYRAFLSTPLSAFQKPMQTKKERAEEREARQSGFRNEDARADGFTRHATRAPVHFELLETDAFDFGRPPPTRDLLQVGELRQERPEAYRIDKQNVHDHGVSSVTRRNLENLCADQQKRMRKEVGASSPSSFPPAVGKGDEHDRLARLRERIEGALAANDDLSWRQKADAIGVMEGLGHVPHSTYGVSERQALLAVWDKIDGSEHEQALTETLAKQLASAVERGSTVCSSGKIARIVSTLDGTGDSAVAVPMWAVREELAGLAVKSRDQNPDDDDAARDEFVRQARRQYVGDLGMCPSIVEPIISEFSHGF